MYVGQKEGQRLKAKLSVLERLMATPYLPQDVNNNSNCRRSMQTFKIDNLIELVVSSQCVACSGTSKQIFPPHQFFVKQTPCFSFWKKGWMESKRERKQLLNIFDYLFFDEPSSFCFNGLKECDLDSSFPLFFASFQCSSMVFSQPSSF